MDYTQRETYEYIGRDARTRAEAAKREKGRAIFNTAQLSGLLQCVYCIAMHLGWREKWRRAHTFPDY